MPRPAPTYCSSALIAVSDTEGIERFAGENLARILRRAAKMACDGRTIIDDLATLVHAAAEDLRREGKV